jgi:uncharacterized membrane protein YeaQ/YmgE (transglycosylase-associated protein family)
MSGPASWAVSVGLGLAGALVGYVIFTLGLGIGDTDIFDWGGLLSAIIGTLIVLALAGYFLRRRQPGPTHPPDHPETTGRDRCHEPEPEPVRIELLLDYIQSNQAVDADQLTARPTRPVCSLEDGRAAWIRPRPAHHPRRMQRKPRWEVPVSTGWAIRAAGR